MAIYQNNGKYYCRFQLDGERHHMLCPGATNLKEALKIENGFIYKLQQEHNGIISKTSSPSFTLKQLLELYVAYNKSNNKQKEPKEKVISICKYFGATKKIDCIKVQDIENYRYWLAKKNNLSNATINRYTSCLSKAYNLAINNNWIDTNPCSKIKLLKEPKETIKFYTIQEEEELYNAIKKYRPDILGLVICAFQTGLRLSNIQQMSWEWIDIKNRIIQIQPQDNKGNKLIRLYISDRLLEVFNNIGVKETGYVFINPETNNIYLTAIRILRKVCKKGNVKYIGFHGIRHTVGTRLMRKGIPIDVIQSVLAHSDIRTTMKYVHLQDNSIKDAITALNSYK